MKALVVIPTYNEAATLGPLLAMVRALPDAPEVLVVDDASPDGTADIVRELARTDPGVHLLERPGKAGLGVAYRAGFGWALQQHYDRIAQMDADLSHPPDRLPALLSTLDDADVAIGSRYVPGGRTEGWPWRRELLSRAGNTYARRALRLSVADSTAGFRAYRAPVLREIGLASVTSGGYCFQVELTVRALHAGFSVVELPITFTERAEGVSKMDRQVVTEALTHITGWALAARVPARTVIHPDSVGAGSHAVQDASVGPAFVRESANAGAGAVAVGAASASAAVTLG